MLVGLVGCVVIFFAFYERAVRFGISTGLEKAGLEGTFEVDASLFSYLEVRDLSVRGTGTVQEARSELIRVDYRLKPLILTKGKEGMEMITIRRVELVMDGERKAPKDDEAKNLEKAGTPLGEKLKYLKYSALDASEIDVRYKTAKEDVVVEGVNLNWNPESREGNLEYDQVEVAKVELKNGMLGISIDQAWAAIELSGLEYMEEIVVESLTLSESQNKAGWVAVADLHCVDADLHVTFDPSADRRIAVDLTEGELNLKALVEALALPDDKMPGGILERLSVVYSGNPKEPRSWNGSAQIEGREWLIGRIGLETMGGSVRISEGLIEVTDLHAEEQSSRMKVTAEVDMSSLDKVAGITLEQIVARGALSLVSENLGELVAVSGVGKEVELGGKVSANLDWGIDSGRLVKLSGPISGDNFVFQAVKIDEVDIDCSSSNPDSVDLQGTIRVDGGNSVTLAGSYAIRSGDYQLTASLASESLGGLRERLTEVAEGAEAVEGQGTLSVDVKGNSKEKELELAGNLSVENLTIGNADPLSVVAGFEHSSERTAIVGGRVSTRELLLEIDAALADNMLGVSKLVFSSGQSELLAGSLEVPCDLENAKSAKQFLSQPGEVSVVLNLKKTRLADFYRIAGRESAGVAGELQGELNVTGSLGDPEIDALFNLTEIELKEQSGEVKPADASLRLAGKDHRLSIDGRVSQPEIEPLSITGEIPMRPIEWVDSTSGTGFKTEAIDLMIRLPETSLSKVEEWVPAVSRSEGVVSANMQIAGTVGAPFITGEARISLPNLKFYKAELPDIRDTECRVEFERNIVHLRMLKGTAAGGAFGGTGTVDLSDTSEPVLNIQLNASEALFYRTEDLSIRSDLQISLSGPLSGVKVEADVGLVNSRYQKEIDLLPIALPERGAKIPSVSGPRAAKVAPKVGITAEPFANWDFDVHLTTKDPFLVVGNLATSEVMADMRISGKGRKLLPSGEVRLENARATLPFSTLEIDRATLSFLPSTGFNPKISVDGEAEVSDYQLRVHVYNTLLNPEYILTSNPPLAEEDIISLIVTGATREQLENSGQGQAVAKGGKLLLEKLRQDMGLSTAEQMLIPRNLTFDIGGVNERTGEPTATAKLKLRERVFILGDLDAEGQYRGVLKWALRFR